MEQNGRSRIGIDLGGTKIEGIALAPDGSEIVRDRVPAPQGSYRDTIAAIVDLVDALAAQAPCEDAVGVGIPGALSQATGLVKNANSTWLIGHPLDRDLAAALGRPVRLANDANCFVLSEAMDGAAKGRASVFGVILGTGVGGGLVIGGKALEGANAIAGEWGHNPLPWPTVDETPGPKCYCGKEGCIETFLSGPGLAGDHERVTGKRLDASQIATHAAQGDAACASTMERYVGRLAKSLATVINTIDPDAIVLGGGLSNIDQLYRDVTPRLRDYVFSDEVTTSVLKAEHGDSSGVRGAARLWP